MLDYEVRKYTARKKGRPSGMNQDAKYIGEYRVEDGVYGLFEIADGVGGQHGGKVASETAVLHTRLKLGDTVRLLADDFIDEEDLESELVDVVNETHQHLRAIPRDASAQSGINTTLGVLLVYGDNGYLADVGDSRIYLYRDGKLEQLTEDREAYLGMKTGKTKDGKEIIDVHTTKVPLKDGDMVLMITDGVYKTVAEGQLKQYLDQFDSEHNVAQKIVSVAKGDDDATAIVIKFRKEE